MRKTWGFAVVLAVGSLPLWAGRVAAQAYAVPQMVCSIDVSMTGARAPKKTGYIDDVDAIARSAEDFRRVLYTGRNMQLIVMTLPPGEQTGAESRVTHDTFVRIEAGNGHVWIDGVSTEVDSTSAVIVPAQSLYKLVNSGAQPLRFYLILGNPEFASNSVRKSKEEADGVPDNFDGCTTE